MPPSPRLRPLLLYPQLLALMLALLAAGPAHCEDVPAKAAPHPHRTHHARHNPAVKPQPASLHLPPGPPVAPAEGAAPVPNQDVAAPRDQQPPETNVEPRIFQLHYPSSGDGYVAGSSPSSIDNEHASKIGGVQLQVPLK